MSQSPIDRVESDSPFSGESSSSFTMSARYYTDSDVYDKEREAIFLVLGFTSDVAAN